jgi:hypothetical protein
MAVRCLCTYEWLCAAYVRSFNSFLFLPHQDATTGEGTINTYKRLDYYLGNLAVKDREQIYPAAPAPQIQNCTACVAAKRVWCYHDNTCFAHGDSNDTKPGALHVTPLRSIRPLHICAVYKQLVEAKIQLVY